MLIKSRKNVLNILKNKNILILLEFLLCLLIVFFTIGKKSGLASLCFNISFVILIGQILYMIFTIKLSKREGLTLFIMFIIVILSLINIMLGNKNQGFTFEYYKKHLIFSSTIIFLFIVSKIFVNKNIVKKLLVINIALAITYIFYYYIGGGRSYHGSTSLLNFNFTNPNLVAMWLTLTTMYLFISIVFFESKVLRLVSIISIVFLVKFLNETGARNAMLTLIVYIILYIYILISKKIKLHKVYIYIGILFPIIFSFIYMYFIKSSFMNIFSFLISEGKGLDSRFEVWNQAFNVIKSHPILGGYYEISNGTGASQMLNTHIDIWSSYGSIVFILVIMYIIRICLKINFNTSNKIQTMGLIGFLATIIMGIGEAAMFSGGQGIYILGCSFLLIARYNEKMDSYHKETNI